MGSGVGSQRIPNLKTFLRGSGDGNNVRDAKTRMQKLKRFLQENHLLGLSRNWFFSFFKVWVCKHVSVKMHLSMHMHVDARAAFFLAILFAELGSPIGSTDHYFGYTSWLVSPGGYACFYITVLGLHLYVQPCPDFTCVLGKSNCRSSSCLYSKFFTH